MVKIYWTFTYIPPFTISFTQTKTEQYCLLHNPKPDCNTFNTLPHITSLYYTLRLLLASFSPFFLFKWGAAPICWSNYTCETCSKDCWQNSIIRFLWLLLWQQKICLWCLYIMLDCCNFQLNSIYLQPILTFIYNNSVQIGYFKLMLIISSYIFGTYLFG